MHLNKKVDEAARLPLAQNKYLRLDKGNVNNLTTNNLTCYAIVAPIKD